jgi:hypothetical protein
MNESAPSTSDSRQCAVNTRQDVPAGITPRCALELENYYLAVIDTGYYADKNQLSAEASPNALYQRQLTVYSVSKTNGTEGQGCDPADITSGGAESDLIGQRIDTDCGAAKELNCWSDKHVTGSRQVDLT